MSTHRTLLPVALTALAVLAIGDRPARAEIKGPGHYRGTYRVDRWGQHRFSFLFVDPDLAPEMAAFSQRPHELHCTDVDQPMNPGGAMIKAIGEGQRLPKPLEISLAWQNEGATGALRRSEAGSSSTLRVTVTPTDDLYGTILSRVSFRVWVESRMPGADGDIQLVSGSNYETYGDVDPIDALAYASSHAGIGVADATISPALMRKNRPGAAFEDDDPRLADGASHSFELTLADLPANEYEIGVAYTFMPPPPPDTREPRTVTVVSNMLRLDVIADEPRASEGVEVRLRRSAAQDGSDGRVALEAVFRNTSDRPAAFHVPRTGDPLVANGSLLAYDAAGSRLRAYGGRDQDKPDVFLLSSERVVLAPGESHVLRTTAPAGTVGARVVYLHRWSTREAHEGVHELSHVWLVSQHLRVDR